MIRPTAVLPSNAPPLQDGVDSAQQASMLLQQHSGNRHGDTTLPHSPQRQSISSLPGHGFPHHHIPPQLPPALYQPPGFNSRRDNPRQTTGPRQQQEQDAENWRKFQYLYRRFQECKPYQNYRNKQAKHAEGSDQKKWPDHVEKAFIQALVKYRPCGKIQQKCQGRPQGRNQLISMEIHRLTGESRCRKQVMSHIQVIRQFVAHDKYILDHLYLPSKKRETGSGLRSRNITSGRRMSNYPVNAAPSTRRAPVAPMLRISIEEIRREKDRLGLDLFQPAQFQMFVQQKTGRGGDEEVVRVHNYTQSNTDCIGVPWRLDNETLRRELPALATRHSRIPIDCKVLEAHASISLPLIPIKSQESGGLELGIFYTCSSQFFHPTSPHQPAGTSQVRYRNTFYDRGVLQSDHSDKQYKELVFQSAGRGVDAVMMFGSNFWVATLASLTRKLQACQGEDVAHHLQGLTAVQEVAVACEQGYQMILIINWRFDLTHGEGATEWRELILPSPTEMKEDDEQPRLLPETYPPLTGLESAAMALYRPQATFGELGSNQAESHGPPTLQSPFEYDSTSAGSALSATTWPTSASDGVLDGSGPSGQFVGEQGSFEFSANNININIPYDPSMNFDAFDSAALGIHAPGTDLVADPGPQDYPHSWYDASDSQHAVNVTEGASFVTNDPSTATSLYDDNPYATQFYPDPREHPSFEIPRMPDESWGPVRPQDPRICAASHDQQAFEGAGQNLYAEDPLSALANASDIARTMGVKAGVDGV